jgi:hypothetical protein
VGSKTFDGVWFTAYSDDHPPPHVHGWYAGIEVLVEFVGGTVRLAQRARPVRPPNGKRSDVNHVLKVAARNAAELMELWRIING